MSSVKLLIFLVSQAASVFIQPGLGSVYETQSYPYGPQVFPTVEDGYRTNYGYEPRQYRNFYPGGYIRPFHEHGLGGEFVQKDLYNKERKGLNNGVYEQSSGKNLAQLDHDQQGYSRGQIALKQGKGDSGYYSDVEGGKRILDDGKHFYGQQHFDQLGQNGDERKLNQGHKKGHVTKGFKTSHHKDESGKTEEYYDEADDHGNNFNYGGQYGKFGLQNGESFRKGQNDEVYNARNNQQGGQYLNHHLIDKENADHGKFGRNRYENDGIVFGKNRDIEEENLDGYSENSKIYKHNPYGHYY